MTLLKYTYVRVMTNNTFTLYHLIETSQVVNLDHQDMVSKKYQLVLREHLNTNLFHVRYREDN